MEFTFGTFLIGIICVCLGFIAGLVAGAVTGEPIDDKAAEKIKREGVMEFVEGVLRNVEKFS